MIKSFIKRTLDPVFTNEALFRRIIKGSLCVFLFHEISEDPSAFHLRHSLNIKPKIFENQLKIISNFFDIIHPNQLCSCEYSDPTALITFDDGSRGSFVNGWPLLEAANIPALYFMNMGVVQGDIFYSALLENLFNNSAFIQYYSTRHPEAIFPASPFEIPPEDIDDFLRISPHQNEIIDDVRHDYGKFASMEDIKLACRSPLLCLGNHLYNHFNATQLSEDSLKTMYFDNQRQIDCFDNGVEMFSYPFGQPGSSYSELTHKVLRNVGAKRIFSAFPKINSKKNRNNWLLHRISINETDVTEADIIRAVLRSTVANSIREKIWV